MAWLIVGLGNPGAKYALTRHNIGFMAVDLLHKACGNPPTKEDFKAVVSKFKWEDQEVVTCMPQTYMNLSGESVQPLAQFYKIPPQQVIVIHDEVDLPFGGFKIVQNRGAGGHNGLKSINEKLGTNDYIRIRLGVGRPPHPEMSTADYVLQKFNSEEMAKMPELLEKCADAIEMIITSGVQKASTQFNK
jgi:PTH1 family peptidyl-tRNA hydrolase